MRCSSAAAVEVIAERVGFQHIGTILPILVIAPGCIDHLVGVRKGDLADSCRRGVRTAINRICLRLRPADKDNFFTIHIGIRGSSSQCNFIAGKMDIAIRWHIAHRAALLRIAVVGQLVFFQIVCHFVSIAVGGPNGVDIGVAVGIGVFAGIGSISSDGCLIQHGDLCHNAILQSIILRLGFNHLIQYRRGAPAYENVSIIGKCLGFYIAGSISRRFIMRYFSTRDHTADGKRSLTAYHMMMGTDIIRTDIVIAMVTNMNGIIIVIGISVAVGIRRIDCIKGDIVGGHGVFIRRDDLVDGLLHRIRLKYICDLLLTPANENRILTFFQLLRTSIIRCDLFACDMRCGLRHSACRITVTVIGYRIELFHHCGNSCVLFYYQSFQSVKTSFSVSISLIADLPADKAIAFISCYCRDNISQCFPVPYLFRFRLCTLCCRK